MSNGGGIIIIRNLVETPGVTYSERYELEQIAKRYEPEHRCSFGDAWAVIRIVWRLLR